MKIIIILTLVAQGSIVQAAASLALKTQRLQEIENLHKITSQVDVEAYRRTLNFEKNNISVDQQIENESLLLAKKLKSNLNESYEFSVKKLGSPALAIQEINSALENDLRNADPAAREALKTFTQEALDEIKSGHVDQGQSYQNLKPIVERGVQERVSYFNAQPSGVVNNIEKFKAHYASRKEVAEALINKGARIAYDSAAQIQVESSETVQSEEDLSLRINLEFFGSTINAGPLVKFKRKFKTKVVLSANDTDSFIKKDGRIDLFIASEGKRIKRDIHFTCKATLSFETEYKGSGELRLFGTGGSSEKSQNIEKEVEITGRRIMFPETIAGKFTSLSMLQDVCSREFLTTKNSNHVSSQDSLNEMMQGLAQSMRLVHPKAQCTVDAHCTSWYLNLGMVRNKNIARCILDEETQEFAYCALRGEQGQRCAVIENGQRVSTDHFEFPCDAGLTCVKISEGGLFKEGFFGRLWAAPRGACQ